MAREAGFEVMRLHGVLPHVPKAIFIANACVTEEVKRFEALVRADERARLQPKKINAAKDEYCHGDERYYANE
jgi:hypothetical protein